MGVLYLTVSSARWSASQVAGSPKVYPQYGDLRGAWAQQTTGPNEYIEVKKAETNPDHS